MATLGQVMVEIGADLKDFNRGMKQVEAQMNRVTRELVGDSAALSSSLDMMAKKSSKGFMTLEQRMNLVRDAIVRSNDMMLAKATQSEKMIKRLAQMNVRGLDRQFLKIAASMEQAAKRGSVLNLAIQNVGRNAPLKTLLDEIKYITQGIARMQGAAMAAGIAFAGLTTALFMAAKGPKPGDVMAQQAELMKNFTDQLNQRAQDIYDFAGLFEKVTVKTKVSGSELIKILKNQVTILANWSKNLKILAKRGVDQGLIAELQKIGPQAAGEVQALVNMSDKQLNQYVTLWREKHRLARTQAMSELEGLRQQTQQKIKELGATVTNLGISLEKFKQTWAVALKPFVQFWGDVAAKVVDAGTALGSLVQKLNEINPKITQLGGMILYLATGLMVLLSPLAIGISRTGSFAAAFAVLWQTIGPVVTGLLSVAGTALLLATAIVVAGAALYEMWQNSEGFRNAIIGLWNGIKQAFVTAFQPILPAFEMLKGAFMAMVGTITGGGYQMSTIWQTVGNAFGSVINTVASVLLPIFQMAFQIAASVIVGVVNILITAFNLITAWWSSNSGTIMTAVGTVWNYIQIAFQAIGSFIMSIIPPIKTMIASAFEFIKTVIVTFAPIVMSVVGTAFRFIWAIVQAVMPLVLAIVVDTWNNIKSAIQAAIAIITNILQLFTNVLKGNWRGAWNNLKAIVSNGLVLIWNLIQLYFLGRILKIVGTFGRGLLSMGRSAWNGLVNVIKSVLNGARSYIGSWTSAIRQALSIAWSGVKTAASAAWNAVKNAIMRPIESAKNFVLRIISTIKNAFARMIIRIPKPKLPHVSVGVGHKSIGGVSIPYPTFSVSWYAKGGIFSGPSIIGVGEAGDEAVLPLSNRRRMRPFAYAVADLITQRGNRSHRDNDGGVHIHIAQLVVREEADIERIAERLHRLQQIKQRAGGVQFAD